MFMDISEFVEIAKGLHVLGIKITKDDELINEWYSEEECRRNIYSATKSFTSCAVGFAVQEGLLSLDEKLTDAFSEFAAAVVFLCYNCCRVCLNVVSECMDDIVYRCFSFPHIKSCEIHCRKEQCLLY